MLFKQISVLFALCLVSQSLSSAELTEREDGITWRYEILGDGYIQILGTGVKDSYAQRDLEGTLVIPNSLNRYVVCSIGSSAFNDYDKITELVIPDSVTNIASRAFYSCNVLASVRLPTSLRSIGSEAFRYCGQLKTAAIPTGVRQIGNNAFRGTKVQGSLRFDEPDITIGDYAFYETSVVNMRCGARAKIGSSAFYGCNALTGVSVGAESSIGSYAFSMCSQLVSIEFPYDVAEIGVGAFSRNDLLEEVLFHGNVDALGEEAFSMCMVLKRVDFIGDVGTIGDYSFLGDECLESVSFASNVCEVGSYAFAYCSALSSCELPHTTESLGVAAFQDCIALTSFVVPSNVTEVSDAAFSGCSSLSSVTFHDDIIRIGVAAFEDCESLLVLSLPRTGMEVCQEAFVRTGYWNAWDATVPIVVADGYFLGIKGVCEGMLDLRLIDCVSYPQGALHGQVKLTELYLPTNVPMSVAMCSGCEALETVHFPTNLTEIPARAFEGCAALESFELPKTLRLIGDSAFAGCSSIETLALNDGLTTIGKQAFRDCSKITSLEIPTSVTQIGSDAFRGCSLIQHYKGSVVSSLRDICPDAYLNIADVTLPEGATTLAANAFADCSALSDISLPTTLKGIGTNAFAKCVALTSIDIPPAVTALPDDAFNGCAALTTFAFTTNYVSIGKRCFKNCHALQGLDIPYTVKTIGEAAFEGCSFDSISIPAVAVMAQVFPDTYEEIATLSVPFGCTQVAAFAFSNLTALASVDLPKTVKTLGIGAFYGCSGMAAVSIPDAVSVLPDDAFNGCTGLLAFEFTKNHISIGKRCFKDCSSMTDLSVSYTVKTIGEAAFEGCSFDSITIPPCTSLAEVFPDTYRTIAAISVPSGVTSVARLAYTNFTSLASIAIPVGVTEVGTNAFWGCVALSSIELPYTLKSLGANAFLMCTNVTSAVAPMVIPLVRMFPETYHRTDFTLQMPVGMTEICAGAFSNCFWMTTFEIPYTVTTIGANAFDGCSFETIVVPERVSNVGAKAFANNGKLKAVKYLGNRPESVAEDAYYGTEVDMVSLHLVHRTGWEDGKSAWLSRDVATYDTDEYVVYFITFMMGYEGGPEQDPVKQDYISGRPYENVPVPTRPYPFGGNYRFLGWYTQPDGLGGEKIDTSSPVSFEGTCYPHWGRPFCAYVGETGYETLQEAFDAVAISNVVSFGGSLTNPGEVVTNLAGAVIGKPCALDLQGRSLIHFSDDCLFHVCSGAEFVISNGVVVCITNAGPALKVTEHSIARMSNVSLSQDSRIGATVSATDGSSLFFSGACVVESGNTDLSARGTAISLDSTSELIISNGLYYGAIDLTEPPLQSGQVSIVGGKFSNDPSSFLSSLRKAVYLDGEEMFEVRPAGWAGVSVGGEIPQALEELGLTDEAAKTVLRNYPPYYFNEFCEWALDGATTDAEIAEKLGPVRASQNVIRAFVLDDRDLLTAPPLTSANLRVDSFEMDPHGGASTLVLSFPGVAVGTRIRHELLGDVIETEGTSDLSAGFSSSNVTLSGFAVGGGNVQVEISPKNASTAFFYRVKLK